VGVNAERSAEENRPRLGPVFQQTATAADVGEATENKVKNSLNCVTEDIDDDVEQVHDCDYEGGAAEVRSAHDNGNDGMGGEEPRERTPVNLCRGTP
jgi:hypothetical protein